MRSLIFLGALLAVLAISYARVDRAHVAHACNAEGSCKLHDFKRAYKAEPITEHKITIWTTQKGIAAQCDSLLMAVSDPKSPRYGQHFNFSQIHDLVYDEKALKAIHSFLDKHGVPVSARSVAPNGEFVEVLTTVEKIEKMFSAEMHVYKSASLGKMITRSQHYVIPAELAHEVSIIHGIHNFPNYRKHTNIVAHGSKRDAMQTHGGMNPQLIWQTYRIPNETDPTTKSDMGVFEALGQSYDENDLATFQQTYNLPRESISKIIGPNDPSSCSQDPNNCVEATLDVEYIMAMAQGAPVTYWSIADEYGDIFLEWAQAIAKTKDVPLVFSISYGGPEHLQDQNDMKQFSIEACKMGLRGITIFVASGDDGVAGYEARDDKRKCGFYPEYPAAVPYVTSVGATMGPALTPAQSEVVCQSDKGSIITTGGGFSTVFPQPSWQSAAVSTWLKTGPAVPPQKMFNQKGRAYPDVSSLGNAYNIVVGGQWYQVSGTSASSPVFCGMVTLINGDRIAAGKAPLGFLNPVLYSVDKTAYNDIVSGENNCCAGGMGSPVCCQYGFTAGKGWDPTTGWGSLDYPIFEQALDRLP